MKRAAWSRWLRSLFPNYQKLANARRPKARRLFLETFEERIAPATRVWDGGGLTNNWSDPANWQFDTAPVNGDDIVFPISAAKFLATNDIENLLVNSITFSGSGYTLNGLPITLGQEAANTGFIIANLGSTNNVIDFNILFGGAAGNRQFFTVGTTNAELRINGQLIGASGVGLSKDGPGTLILTADNSGFMGEIFITEGQLNVRHANALGSSSAPTTIVSTFTRSGQLQIENVAGNIFEPIIVNGAGPQNDGALINIAGINTLAGSIVLDSDSTLGARAGTMIITGVISDTGSGHNITKEGPGSIIFDPLNTATGNLYRGRTIINQGILGIRHSLALGNDVIPVYGVNDTVVQSFPNRAGTLQIQFVPNAARIDPNVNPSGDGFTVPRELLTLNGPGIETAAAFPRAASGATVTGALNNLSGHNTWAQNISLWSDDTSVFGDFRFWAFTNAIPSQALPTVGIGVETGSTLFLTGNVVDTNLSGGLTSQPDYSFIKTRGGRLVLVNANTYRGRTEILAGYLNIRDSQALGAGTNSARNATWIFPGATLELEADQIADSQAPFANPPHALPHLNTDIVISQEAILPMGNGVNNDGAIRNIRGVNELTGTLVLQLLIPRGNVSFTGTGVGIGVEPDHGPDFLPFDRSQLTISGQIIDDNVPPFRSNLTKFGLGELVLTASNTYTGQTFIRQGWITIRNNRALGGAVPGPDTIQPETYVAQGAMLVLKQTRSVNPLPIVVPERIIASGQGIDHRFPELNQRGAILNLSNLNTITGIVTLVATNAFPRVGIGADIDSTDVSVTFSELTFTNLIQEGLSNAANVQNGIPNPPALIPAGFDKLGRKRIYLQGQGTYTGNNRVVEGVIRIQHNTALGMLDGTTQVLAGAALEIAGYSTANVPLINFNGGLPGGIQVKESLILAGSGNVTADDPTHDFSFPVPIDTLVNLNEDNLWNGPVVLLTDVRIDTKNNSRLAFYKPITGPGGFVKRNGGILVLGGNNEFQGEVLIEAGVVNLQSPTALGSSLGGTTITADAQLQLQGDLTIAGEKLTVIGNGPDVAPNIPLRWFPQGPAPINEPLWSGNFATGRVTGVVPDPFDSNVLYVSAAGGGAWRSKNSGFTWEPLIDNAGIPGLPQVIFTGAIAVAPTDSNTIYVGLGEANNSGDSFYGRGILRSTNYGQSWTLIQPPGNAFDRKTISKIVVDPVFPNVIYVAVMGSGTFTTPGNFGVWRFDGANWTNLTNGLIPTDDENTVLTTENRFTDLVVYNAHFQPTPNNRVIAFTVSDMFGFLSGTTSGAYISVDSGATWTRNSFPSALETFTGASGTQYTNQPRNGRIEMDGTKIGNVVTLYAAIAFPVNFPRQDQGTAGTFREVVNTAATYNPATGVWTIGAWAALGSQPSPQGSSAGPFGTQGWYNIAIAVNPTNPNFVFLGGVGGPFTSGPHVYNGTDWIDVDPGVDGRGPHVDYHSARFDRNGRLVVGNDGGIWRMENTTPPAVGQAIWTNLNGNFLQITQFVGIDSHPTNPFFAIGGSQDNGTKLFNDSYTWASVDLGDGGIALINNKNPNVMFHVQNGVLRRSLAGGVVGSWTTIRTTSPQVGLYFPFVLDRVNPSRLVYPDIDQFGNGILFESLNSDAPNPNWSLLNANTPFGRVNGIGLADRQGIWAADPDFPLAINNGADSYDPSTIYVLSSTGVFLTKNGGLSWVNRSSGLAGGLGNFVDIAVDPRNRDVVYVVRAGFGGNHVFKTTNAGRTWVNISGNLPDLPTYKVVVDPRNGDVYIGNDNGVYHLPGGSGSTWTRFGVGMPNVQVRNMALNTQTNTIIAGTYGRGMFQLFLDDRRDNSGGVRAISGSSVWTGEVVMTGPTTFRAEVGAQVNFVGVISDVDDNLNTVTKTGAGRVVFSGANTYKGLTDIVEGALVVRNPSALGSSDPVNGRTIVRTGAALELQSDLALEFVELNGNGGVFNDHFTGALRNVSNNNTFTGTLFLNTNSTIGVDSGSQLTIGTKVGSPSLPGVGTITDGVGVRGFTKELTGKLILNSANTYDGFTDIAAGELQIQHSLALGNPGGLGTQVRNGAQLELNVDLAGNPITVIGEQLDVSGTGVNATGAVQNIAGNNVWAGNVRIMAIPSLPAPPPPTPPNKASFAVDRAQDTLTISGTISEDGGSFGLDKIGPGRLTLTADNSYSGLTNILGGALRAAARNALGTGGTTAAGNGTIVSAGAALELFSDSSIIFDVEEIILNGRGIAPANLGALRNVAGVNEWTGNIVLNSTVSAASGSPNPIINIGVDAGSELLVRGADIVRDPTSVPSLNKAAELHKVGEGKLTFANANSYAGLTVVEAGVLNIQNNNSLGRLLNEVQTINIIGLGGSFTLGFGNPMEVTGNIPAGATAAQIRAALEALPNIGPGNVAVTRNVNFVVVTFQNALGGVNLPQLVGNGTAGTTVSIATVQNGGPSAGTIVQNGATLQVQNGITVSNEALTLNGPGFDNQGALANVSNNNTWDSSITLGSDSFIGVSQAGDTLTISQSIGQASAGLGVTKVGPGTLLYTGGAGTSNTYTGLTQVNQGTLQLNKTGGAVAINGDLTVGDTLAGAAAAILLQPNQIVDSATVRVESDGLFDLNGLAETIAALRILDGDVFTHNNGLLTTTTLDMVGGRLNIGLNGQLILNGNVSGTSSATETALIDGLGRVNLNNATRTFAVSDGPQPLDMRVGVEITGNAGLNKNGSGVLVLEKPNSYTGLTTVFNGDLRVNGTVGNVDLEGGTLSGTGTVGTIDGGNPAIPAVGVVSPGGSTGILRSGSNVWGPGTTFRVELNSTTPGTGHDQLQVTGSIDLGNASIDGFIGPNVAIGDSFVIITATGGVTGEFDVGNVVFIDGKKFSIAYLPNSVVITRIKADVVMQLTSSSNPSVYGQPVTFTVTVTPEPGAGPLPGTGTVTFTLDGIQVPDKPLVNNQAVLDPVLDLGLVLSVGTHQVQVTFNGDGDFNAQSRSLTPNQLVNRAPTSITVTQSPATPVFGQPVTVTVGIKAVPPGGTALGANVPTGLVTFIVNNGPPQNLPINAAGNVQLILNSLTTGQHIVKVQYQGDENYLPIAPAQDLVINVQRANVNVLVTAQPVTAPLGETVRFTASVTAAPPGAGFPTGTVAFFDGVIDPSNLLGQAAINPLTGLASIDTSVLTVGMHTIIAQYVGDSNFNANTGTLNYTVGAATTATTLAVAPNPSVFGQAVQFTATVRTVLPGLGTPSGTVTFFVDGVALPSVSVDSQGVARISVNSLEVGNRTITARFDGNANFALSSDSRTQVVQRAATQVAINTTLNPVAVNQPVTINATVTSVAPGQGVPSGTVTFFVNGVNRGNAPVVNGVASLPLIFNTQGTFNVTATYSGSGNHLGSNSPALQQTVVPFTSTVNLTKSVATSVFGQPVTYTAVVRGGLFGTTLTQIPGGTVTFFVNGVARGTVALNQNGLARLQLNLGVGNYNVTARYNGTANFASSSMTVNHTVNPANTAVQLSANRNPAIIGQQVTVTATVVAVAPGRGVPPGTVTFVVNGVAQTPLPVNAQGQVSLNLGALPLGTHVVTAIYNGAPSYNGSQSVDLVINVIEPLPASRLTAALTSAVSVATPFGIRVVARDQFGNPVPGFNQPATITILSAPAGATLTGPRTANFVNGVATFNNLRVNLAGRYVLRIIAGGLFVDLVINAQGRLV